MINKGDFEQSEEIFYIKHLISLFGKSDSVKCTFALEALGKIGDATVVHLINAFDDEHIRYWVVRTLGEIGNEQAIESLITALKDDDGEIGFAASEALSKFGEKAVPFLLSVLNEPDWNSRCNAINALGQIKSVLALMPIVACLNDTNAVVRDIAALALGEIEDKQAVAPLIELLKDESLSVRISAILTLSKLGDNRAIEPLIELLGHEVDEVRFHAISALSIIGNTNILPKLEWLVENDKGEVLQGKIKDNALRAIEQIAKRK